MMRMNTNNGNDDDHTEQAPFAKVVSFPKSLAISFATRFACKVPFLIFILLLILLNLLFLFKLLSEFDCELWFAGRFPATSPVDNPQASH